MKQNETVTYRRLGTIRKSRDEDGEEGYWVSHYWFGNQDWADTLKEAREMLTYQEEQSIRVRDAISLLQRHNYKIFKEIG